MNRRELLAVPIAVGLTLPAAGVAAESGSVAASLTELRQKMPASHPRILIRSGEVTALKAFLDQDPRVSSIASAMKRLEQVPGTARPPPEPMAALGKSGEETSAARAAWRAASNAAITAQLFGLRALIYERPADRGDGISWLLALVNWRMTTEADYWRNPEAFVQTLNGMVFAFDWLYPFMSSSARRQVEDGLGERTNTLFAVMRKRLSLDRPPQPADGLSHPVRYLSILGHAAMALWGHHPTAQEQLAWILAFYTERFPPWGGDDGGWSEGIEYQSSALSQHLRLLEDLHGLGVTGPLDRPFWRNTGYFLARFLPPYESSSFSDLPTSPRPTASRRLLLDKLARLNRDGQLLTLAGRYGSAMPGNMDYYQFGAVDSIFHVWRTSQQPRLQASSIDDLARSWHFRDIGWVSMQSSWEPRGDSIMLGFKSSPIGSVSHGFADQNAFVINAYRHAMAVSTGMRDWFGSPHYERWTRATRSSNAILVDGQGAPVHDASATGKIVRFVAGARSDFVTGDASAAYKGAARRVVRHILFVDRRYFVMLDEIAGDAPVMHQWLLHARVAMQIDEAKGRIDMRFADAGLQVHLLAPTAQLLIYRQTDRHDPPPEVAARSVPSEWHVTVETRTPAKERQFLAVLHPWREEAPTGIPQRRSSLKGNVIEIGNEVILIADEASGGVASDTHQLVGRAAYQLPGRLAMIEAQVLKTPTTEIWADSNITAEMEQTAAGWILDLQPHAELRLTLNTAASPQQVAGPAGTRWTIAENGKQLRLQLSAADRATQLRIEW